MVCLKSDFYSADSSFNFSYCVGPYPYRIRGTCIDITVVIPTAGCLHVCNANSVERGPIAAVEIFVNRQDVQFWVELEVGLGRTCCAPRGRGFAVALEHVTLLAGSCAVERLIVCHALQCEGGAGIRLRCAGRTWYFRRRRHLVGSSPLFEPP